MDRSKDSKPTVTMLVWPDFYRERHGWIVVAGHMISHQAVGAFTPQNQSQTRLLSSMPRSLGEVNAKGGFGGFTARPLSHWPTV